MLTRQIRYVTRKLARSPLFTTICVMTLALGIGANTAIFTVVNGVLLKPLPFPEPDQLVGLWHEAPGLGFDSVNQSPALHYTYVEATDVFEDVAMWDNDAAAVTGLEEPERVSVMRLTHRALPLLGVEPFVGRRFSEEDDSHDSPETVILSHGYWQKHFGGHADAIGKTLEVDGRAREIIGVMPEGFRFLRYDPAIYVPFRFDLSNLTLGNFSYQGMARVRPGVTIEQVNAAINRLLPVAAERYSGGINLGMLREARFAANAHLLKEDLVGDVGGVLWVLMGSVGIVLLIACANVANLFLVRAEGRQEETAVRTALGASRAQIAREYISESLFLATLGGVLGLALAWAGVKLLLAIGPESIPRLEAIAIEPVVLLFAASISLLSGLLFGMFPVLKYGVANLSSALKEGGRGGSEGRERHLVRHGLVVAQITLALVLLVGSGLMIRSFQALLKVDPGFRDPDQVLTLRVSIPQAEIEDNEEAARAHQRIHQLISQIPGVTSVGVASSATMDGWDSNDGTHVEEFPVEEDQIPPIRRFKWIGENYFQTMGNPLLTGRTITWDDVNNHHRVVVVTENFATEYWDSPATAVGKRVRQNPKGDWFEIAGVVGNVHDDGVDQEATTVVFWPMVVEDFWAEDVFVHRSMVYVIRSPRVGTPGLVDEVRSAVWSVNANLPLAQVRTLREILETSTARTSFALVIFAIAAAVALLLGAVGIYGVISYAVAQRSRELALRMALGAERRDVSRLVIRQAVGLAAAGILVGLMVAVGVSRLMSSILFGVNPVDPLTYAAVAVGLGAVALVASYIPARRAANVDPIEVLRWE